MDDLKQCSICKDYKPNTTEFFEVKRATCKICRSEQQKIRNVNKKDEDIILFKSKEMAYSAYSRVFAKSRDYKKPYRNLINPFGFTNPKEMMMFLYDNYYNDIKGILDKGLIPSVDRIDSSIGYTPNNIRIINFTENTLLGVENRKRKIKMIDSNNNVTIFDSTVDCVVYFGKSKESSSRVKSWILKDGKYKIPEGYSFEYVDE